MRCGDWHRSSLGVVPIFWMRTWRLFPDVAKQSQLCLRHPGNGSGFYLIYSVIHSWSFLGSSSTVTMFQLFCSESVFIFAIFAKYALCHRAEPKLMFVWKRDLRVTSLLLSSCFSAILYTLSLSGPFAYKRIGSFLHLLRAVLFFSEI